MYEREVQEKTPILFALSTCPRCNRMKQFLDENRVQAVVVDVDLLPPSEKQAQLEFLRMVNPAVSMPTLVVGEFAVLGEDYDGVREALRL
jgi:glutaredoxin-like protein NrdH